MHGPCVVHLADHSHADRLLTHLPGQRDDVDQRQQSGEHFDQSERTRRQPTGEHFNRDLALTARHIGKRQRGDDDHVVIGHALERAAEWMIEQVAAGDIDGDVHHHQHDRDRPDHDQPAAGVADQLVDQAKRLHVPTAQQRQAAAPGQGTTRPSRRSVPLVVLFCAKRSQSTPLGQIPQRRSLAERTGGLRKYRNGHQADRRVATLAQPFAKS